MLAEQVHLWASIEALETEFKVKPTPEPDLGFCWAAHQWANGRGLAQVLAGSELPAGDFVRWCKGSSTPSAKSPARHRQMIRFATMHVRPQNCCDVGSLTTPRRSEEVVFVHVIGKGRGVPDPGSRAAHDECLPGPIHQSWAGEAGWPRFDGRNQPESHISVAGSIKPGPHRRLWRYCGPHVMRRRAVLRWTNRIERANQRMPDGATTGPTQRLLPVKPRHLNSRKALPLHTQRLQDAADGVRDAEFVADRIQQWQVGVRLYLRRRRHRQVCNDPHDTGGTVQIIRSPRRDTRNLGASPLFRSSTAARTPPGRQNGEARTRRSSHRSLAHPAGHHWGPRAGPPCRRTAQE